MRVLVQERRIVAVLLAGGPPEGLVDELVDEELRAVAVAVIALRAWRQAPTDDQVIALARAQGVAISDRDCEVLRREGAMRRAA